jgi:uridine kinase
MEVPQDSEEHAEAHRLLKSLRFFKNVPDDIIAETSLLREFVGGSAYEQ